jgi:hypothetical protein
MDNSTFSKNQLVRYALTTDEVAMLDQVHQKYPDAVLGLDGQYLTAARQLLGYAATDKDWGDSKLTLVTDNLLTGNFRSLNASVVLIRRDVVNNPIGEGGGVIYRLGYDPKLVIVEQGFRLVEDNGSVAVFVRDGY